MSIASAMYHTYTNNGQVPDGKELTTACEGAARWVYTSPGRDKVVYTLQDGSSLTVDTSPEGDVTDVSYK